MNIVKHWSESNWQSSQKKHSHWKNKNTIHAYLSTVILSSLIGTYLDLLMVGTGLYSFPIRPFPEVFSIHIIFTLCILPIFSVFVIAVLKRLTRLQRYIFIFICSFIIFVVEQITELLGFFTHSSAWKHEFSLVGYFIFMVMIWKFYKWMDSK
ncbi:CBO0543 family protein [Oceanobacillus senegalensis]|uniref:CBO0543 family protein n=1 Tax=Oceanobacillus senegalensis TaxID=1936063 RepID=UPI003CCC0FCB